MRKLPGNICLERICNVGKFGFEVNHITRSRRLCTNDKSEARSTHNTLLLHRIESGEHHSLNYLFS